jgi:hypothetical protein
MQIKLDPQQGYVINGKFNQPLALENAGVKAAICFRESTNGEKVSPEIIRESETSGKLISRGINTIFDDHGTPNEQQLVSLEITEIPKILCMVLNNEHQYSACERSLRYTEIEPNDYISEEENILYKKWLDIFENIIIQKYFNFYRKFNSSDKMTQKAIHKIAQENARYMVSVFQPTTLTYTVPFAQINKIAIYMERVINNPQNELEELLIPYFKDFIKQLKDLKVLITKDDVYHYVSSDPEIKKILVDSKRGHEEILSFANNQDLLYKNNKNIDLSLFSWRNKFSAIKSESEFGHTISYNNKESFACLAQEQRHRTIDCEMAFDESYEMFIPPILNDYPDLKKEWILDSLIVENKYPQGMLLMVNRISSVKNIIDFVSKERCCERAQLEIEQVYYNQIIPDTYENLLNKDPNLAETIKPYVKKLRCQYKDYTCPSFCGHPRQNRDI